jgi:hypothetical protein
MRFRAGAPPSKDWGGAPSLLTGRIPGLPFAALTHDALGMITFSPDWRMRGRGQRYSLQGCGSYEEAHQSSVFCAVEAAPAAGSVEGRGAGGGSALPTVVIAFGRALFRLELETMRREGHPAFSGQPQQAVEDGGEDEQGSFAWLCSCGRQASQYAAAPARPRALPARRSD